jgi:hypothetical protein
MSSTRAKPLERRIEQTSLQDITPDHFRARAKHYRLAAALANVPRDAADLRELALMFDQIAGDFDQVIG